MSWLNNLRRFRVSRNPVSLFHMWYVYWSFNSNSVCIRIQQIRLKYRAFNIQEFFTPSLRHRTPMELSGPDNTSAGKYKILVGPLNRTKVIPIFNSGLHSRSTV